MADVKFKPVRFAMSTAAAGNTQDVTISGFGTPAAAMFTVVSATTDDAIGDDVRISIGITDGTNQAAAAITGLNARGITAETRAHRNDRVITIPTHNAGLPIEGAGFSFNSWITDGVRLDIDKSVGSALLVECVLIGGEDVANATVVTKDDLGTGTSPVSVTVGHPTDLLFAITNGHNLPLPDEDLNSIFSFGCALPDGTQRSSLIASRDAQSTTINNAYISNTKITGQVFNDSVTWTGAVGSFTGTGFSVTPSASAGSDIVSFLSLEFTNSPDIALFDMTWPTSGSYAETNPGFTPTFGLISSLVGPTARDTLATSANFGWSLAVFDDTNIYTKNATSQDGVTTTVEKSLSSDQLRILDDDGSTNAVLASGYAFDADGGDFTLSTNPIAPVLGWGLAIGPGAAGGVVPSDAYHPIAQRNYRHSGRFL